MRYYTNYSHKLCQFIFIEEGMERFQLFLTKSTVASTTQILDELRNIQTMASLRPADRIIIYLGAVFTEQVHY